jgi:hypothetical protein
MNRPAILFTTTLLTLSAQRSMAQAQTSPDPDSLVVEQLLTAGADLRKPTEVIVYLYFPSEGAATSAGERLRTMGFPDVRLSVDDAGEWACVGSREMAPTLNAIRNLSARLEQLAGEYGGEYDGWEAAVRP